MPKIVGIDPKVAKQISCRKCGSINEYTPNEVREFYNGTDIGGGPNGAEGFNCASCGHEVFTRRW